jgi:hypothetical protein
MKRKTIHHLIIMAVFFISLTGCDKNLGIVPVQTKRPVENNVFSSTFPEIRLQINQDFKYLGTATLFEKTEDRLSYNANLGESVEANAYLFGQVDQNNRMAKGVLIRMLVMYGNPSQPVPEFFSKTGRNILESGEMKILDDKYQYDLYAEQELLMPQEKALLGSSRMPSCLLIKKLSIKAGFGNKSGIQVLYFEDLSTTCGSRPCGTCIEPKNRTPEQTQVLQGFSDRSFANIRFLKTRNIEDTTSRYVDAPPKAQPVPLVVPASPVLVPSVPSAPAPSLAPVEKAAPAAAVAEPNSEVLEKRLEALKRIYERNLITKEDYEKKKAEILNQL